MGRRTFETTDDLIEEIEWLASFRLTRERMLDRLGLSAEAVEHRLRRAGRQDVWERYLRQERVDAWWEQYTTKPKQWRERMVRERSKEGT